MFSGQFKARSGLQKGETVKLHKCVHSLGYYVFFIVMIVSVVT